MSLSNNQKKLDRLFMYYFWRINKNCPDFMY